MKVEIRRNRTLSFKLEMSDENRSEIKKWLEGVPKLNEKQRQLLDRSERYRRAIEEKIWADIESKQPVYDLLGNPISRETHEICYDMYQYKEEDGLAYIAAKAIYIQPKKSEYNKEVKV